MSTEPVERFPKGALWAAALLVTFTIAITASARLSGIGVTKEPDSVPAKVLELNFEDRPDGAVAVYRASDKKIIEILSPGSNGFVRNVMRGMARERKMHQQGRDVPFRMIRWADGRLSVEDPTTGRRVDLGAFGSNNTNSFARLMTSDGAMTQ